MLKPIKLLSVAILCIAFLVGCTTGLPDETTVPSTTSQTEATAQTETTESTESSEVPTEEPKESQLSEIHAKLQQDGSLCAVAYVGYNGGTFQEIQEGFVTEGLTEVLPILSEIGEDYFFSNDGSELYLIVPDTDVGITVMERSMDETTGETLYGDTLYTGTDGSPILLRGNISDIFPNLSLFIAGQGGETQEYCPSLSLRDGMLWVETTLISDFTPYELLGIYTEPEYDGEDPLMSSWFTEAPNTAGETMVLELVMIYDGSASYCYGPENAELYEYFEGGWFYDGDLLCLSLTGGPLGDPDGRYDFYSEFRWEYSNRKLTLTHVSGNPLIYGLDGGSMEFRGASQAALIGLWSTSYYIFETDSYIYTDLELMGENKCNLLIHNGTGTTYAAYEGTWTLTDDLLDIQMQMFSGNNYLDSITQSIIGTYEPVIDADGWLKLFLLQGDAITSYMSECGYEFFQPTISYG